MEALTRMRTNSLPGPHVRAAILWLLSLLLFWQPLRALAGLSFQDENSTHILLIPAISALLIYLERGSIFRLRRDSLLPGVPLLLVAISLWYGLQAPLASLDARNRMSAQAALIVLVWIAIFVLCYGAGAFKAATFPLLYLSLMIPLPAAVIDGLISFLQKASADTSYVLFRLLGTPVLRHGFRFSLPGLEIEVARECSGIHSALSLLIAGLLVAYFALPGARKRILFVACILPIAIFKNAVRIVTLAWLSIYVNPAIIEGRLHRQGGVPFSVIALILMAVLLWVLRRRSTFSLGRTLRTAYSHLHLARN